MKRKKIVKRTSDVHPKANKRKVGPRCAAEQDRTGILLQSLLDKEQEILHTEDALVESMKRFRDLFEQSPIGVGIHDPKGELLIVNKAFLDILGLVSFREIDHHNLFVDLKLGDGQAKALKNGVVVQYEAEYDFAKAGFKTKKEGVAYLLIVISPLFREKSVIGYMTQIQDVTERRKIAEAQRLAQLGRLLSDMAHEVNNPLMIISGRAELALVAGGGNEKLRDSLKIIIEQCFFAKDIIQRLLRYSRVGKIERKAVDIVSALTFVTDILSHHLRMSTIEIKKDLAEGLSPVNGNEKELQEVFMNIINNSADAMPGGGEIKICARADGNFARVEFSDTGEGMSQKVLERIFEPFFTTKQKGTGLGLAVCHTIVQEHGGDLFYESRVGEGTKATVMLPLWQGAANR